MPTVLFAAIWHQLLVRIQSGPLPIHGPIELNFEALGTAMRQSGPDQGVPVTHMIVTPSLLAQIRADDQWLEHINKVSSADVAACGYMGQLLGMELWSVEPLDQQHPQVEKLNSLPGLIFRDARCNFHFFMVNGPTPQEENPELEPSLRAELLELLQYIADKGEGHPLHHDDVLLAKQLIPRLK